MCLTTKDSLMALIIMVFLSVLLIVRNHQFDRIFGIFFFFIAAIQLIEALHHSKQLNDSDAGQYIFLTLLSQIVVLALLCYYYYPNKITGVWLAAMVIIFVMACYSNWYTKFAVITEKHLIWSSSTGSILGVYSYFYLLGLLVPFLILLYLNHWKNLKLWLVLAALILSFFITLYVYPNMFFSTMWCYGAIGIIFVMWMVGAFSE